MDTVLEVPAQATDGRRCPTLVLVIGCALAAFLLVKPLFITSSKGDHYAYLAASFARWQLDVDTLPQEYQDVVTWQGHKYLPLGPLPGAVLVPVLPLMDIGRDKVMTWVGEIFTLLNVWIFYRVLGLAGVGGERRWWGLLLFFAGTVYLSAVAMGTSWFFAHVLTTTLLLWATFETLGKGRPWVVGLALGLAGATRLTALFALPFFLYILWLHSRAHFTEGKLPKGQRAYEGGVAKIKAYVTPSQTFMSSIGLLALGLLGPVALLYLYNYLRFGSGLESGYGHAVLTNPVLAEALSRGLFSVEHIPKNLFMLLLQGPLPFPSENAAVLTPPYIQPSQWGMGIFFTSPALLYSFRADLKNPLVRACVLGVVSVLIPLITYYGIGWLQFGYRYALDFLPMLLLIATLSFPKSMTNAARALVLFSVAVNVWGTIFLLAWT